MTPRGSLTTILTTMLGASLGGLILWRVFRTQRKKLPPVQEVAQLVSCPVKEVYFVECQSTQIEVQPVSTQTEVQPVSTQMEVQPVSSSSPIKKDEALECQPTQTLHCIEKEIEAVKQTATAQLSPSVRLPSPEQLLGVKPVMVRSEEQWDQLWPSLQKELSLFPVLGLDCEWVKHNGVSVNGKISAVSLLQIATYSGLCVLVRLVSFRGGQQSFPLSLIEVLRDPHILKVGVGCYEDGKRLTRDYGMSLGCTVDLRYLALRQRQVTLNNGLSLQSLAADVLNVSMDKSLKLRCSDWEADQLTPEQMTYAARDAQVSIALFFHLLGLDPETSSPTTTGSTYSELAARCQGLMDVPFRHRMVLDGEEKIADGERRRRLRKTISDSPESGDQQVPDPRKNNKRKPLGVGYSARKSPLYDNCFLHAPDGQPLCTCDKKKATWYLSKGIGELLSEDPFIVRLLFEPSGRPDSHQDYYLTAKENLCVVCGKADSYIRKNIVPHEYRRHFPTEMKDHNSHDILLLCTACHAASNVHDGMLKQQLADEYGAPQGCEEGVRVLENSDRRRVRSAARALLTARDSLPENRREELEAVVRGFYSDVESEAESVQSEAALSPEALQTASGLETRIFNEAYVPHGLKVVRTNAETGLRGLMELERRWRQHFLTTMKPRHLPPLWSVDHNHSKFLFKYGEDLAIQLN